MAKKKKDSSSTQAQSPHPDSSGRLTKFCALIGWVFAAVLFVLYFVSARSPEDSRRVREEREDPLHVSEASDSPRIVQRRPHGKVTLKAAESGLTDLMRSLQGDRFSEGVDAVLRRLESTVGPQQFAARLLFGYWHLHRNQLSQAKQKFDSILKDGTSPSEMTERIVSLWRSAVDHMQRQESREGKERLLEEREAFADVRRSLTLGEPYEKVLWDDLFHTEGMWLIGQLPDHNNKDNSKCLYVPGLLAKEFYSVKLFPEARSLEQAYKDIMRELNPYLENAPFNAVGGSTAHTDASLVRGGKWTDVSLFSAGAKNAEACAQLPRLCALLERELPEATRNVQGHALLSRMDPGTKIQRHHGSSNSQLTMHLGLVIPRGAGIEVNGKQGKWKEGKVLIFDDSFYHSVWHKGTEADGPRLVLLLRGYHPEWTLEERAGLIMGHKETPWTMEEREREVRDLSTPAAQERWASRKRWFLHGQDPTAASQDL